MLPAQTNGASIHGPDSGSCWVGQQLRMSWKVMEACGFAFSHLFLEHKYLSKAVWPDGDSAGQLASLSKPNAPVSFVSCPSPRSFQVLPGVLIS